MISRGERKKEKEELIININNQRETLANFKVYIHRSLAFESNNENMEMLRSADQKAKLDGWSFNKFVAVAVKEYLQHHPLPNPQAQIDRMLTVEMPHKPVSQCCVPSCRGKARFLLTLRNHEGKNEQFQVCNSHKRWLHPQFRYLVSYREIS